MNSNDEKSPNIRMRAHGFSPSENRGGARWYSRPIEYEGSRALVAVKDREGVGMPQSLNDPVIVGIHDLRTGEELRTKHYESLRHYLEALDKNPSQSLP